MAFGISKGAYVILFLMAIPVFFIVRALWRRWIRGDVQRAILAIISTLALVPLLYVGLVMIWFFSKSFYISQDFEKEKWQENKMERYRMVDDIIESELLIGKSKKEVVKLLGQTDTTSNRMRYNIGYEPGVMKIDPSFLVIEFEEGEVAEVKKREG